MAQDTAILPANARLKFSHALLEKPLYIVTGANSIKWSYELNTRSQPTYGGEVIQILSAYVGPITITGNTRSASQLRDIYHWFRAYMTLAGLGKRSEVPMLFEYPERGWSFSIQPTSIPGFKYGTEELGTEYRIEAEMVSNRQWNVLARSTMNGMTESLTKEYLATIGFNPRSPLIDPSAPANKNGGINDFGENFQRLTAAWTTGDFQHWGFDAMRDPGQQFSQTAEDYYTAYFGSKYISGSTDTPSGGAILLGNVDDEPTQLNIAAAIASTFEDRGVPGQLGVAIAMVESGGIQRLNPDARQPDGDFAVGLFQTFPKGIGGTQKHAKQLGQAFNARSEKVTKYYKPSMQISDAADWFKGAANGRSLEDASNFKKMKEWAQAAQGAGCSYTEECGGKKFAIAWDNAGELLERVKAAGEVSGTVRNKVVEYAKMGVADKGSTHYSQGSSRLQIPEKKGQLWDTDCSGWVTGLYYWATDGDQKYNPNGSSNGWRSAGFTGTMLNSSNGKDVSEGEVRPGDLIIYGGGTGAHVNVYLGDGKMAGFGSEGGPREYSFPSGNSSWPKPVRYRSFLP